MGQAGGEPFELLGMTSAELEAAARARLPSGAGAALELHRQAVLQGRFAPEETGIAARSAAAWRAAFALTLPEVVRVVEESSEAWGEATSKAVLRLRDGLEIECVRIPMGPDKFTLCISSQVGCKMGCSFCETGLMGLLRNLSAAEIVAQIVVARSVLGWPVRNIVFMGMGEALDNADAVIQALRVLADPRGMAIAQQRLTICTVGHAEGIARLSELGWKRLNLAFSLNSAVEERRSALMPINKKTPLAALQRVLADYPGRRGFVLAVNYCLMPGLNDSRADAAAVARFCSGVGRVLLNLIPYNPGTRPVTRAPTEDEIDGFMAWLKEDGVPVRRRMTKGRSVMAACGQLGNAALGRRKPRPEPSIP